MDCLPASSTGGTQAVHVVDGRLGPVHASGVWFVVFIDGRVMVSWRGCVEDRGRS